MAGNVRELQNYLEQASMSQGEEIVCPESLNGRPAGLGLASHRMAGESPHGAAAAAPFPHVGDPSGPSDASGPVASTGPVAPTGPLPTLAEVEREHIRLCAGAGQRQPDRRGPLAGDSPAAARSEDQEAQDHFQFSSRPPAQAEVGPVPSRSGGG